MLNLTKPRYVMPVHGDHKRLHLHAELAEAVGIDPERIFKGRNGVAARDRRARRGALRRGHRRRDDLRRRRRHRRPRRRGTARPPDAVGRRRVHRRRDDLLRGRSSVPPPEIIFRGVPFVEEADGLVDELRGVVEASLAEAARDEVREVVAAPGGPPRRRRRVRLRAPAPPADGAAGRRRGLAAEPGRIPGRGIGTRRASWCSRNNQRGKRIEEPGEF